MICVIHTFSLYFGPADIRTVITASGNDIYFGAVGFDHVDLFRGSSLGYELLFYTFDHEIPKRWISVAYKTDEYLSKGSRIFIETSRSVYREDRE